MRNLSIRAFWIADRVKKGEVDIKHEPTEEMVADFFTKPLQGSAFAKLRRIILNETTGKNKEDSSNVRE